ncbi:MGH1-like glycoside hydrolase domain-containing protein [Thalassoglobus sp.]|uniref:MGH1-like glycoside hydrolase domain-containing protein n=1 Tax=Thalassoglobus sp. TaxID=2795869 RepID=UPI003AA831DE
MADFSVTGAEIKRLAQETRGDKEGNWKRWGTYLAERQWGTVREDYSDNGEPWTYFTHDDATWKAYRWGEDGILGWCDRKGRLNFSIAMWNEKDPILKERLFGLSGPEGNHGEDVKECYYYLDGTPTHSYAKGLYKYPQQEFPYTDLVETNRNRTHHDLEYELTDTGIFDENEYFDIFVEYAKASPEDICIRITVANRGEAMSRLHLLPQFCFRNTWVDPNIYEADLAKPRLSAIGNDRVLAEHETLGRFHLFADLAPDGSKPKWLFTENETNPSRLQKLPVTRGGCKDAFHLYTIQNDESAVNPHKYGTKAAARYVLDVPAMSEVVVQLRMTQESRSSPTPFGEEFGRTFERRKEEADAFHNLKVSPGLTEDENQVHRQASAGLLWTKQFYCYSVKDWLKGNPNRPNYPGTQLVRNEDWGHLFNRDVISMPDKWEYPWYAAWDSAFHMIPFANLDIDYAKDQLSMLLRDWYMHPNGQMPAYEWNFSDVNPPVHAWACWRVYQRTGPPGQRDRAFLSKVFQKLLLNFTWWVNRKDVRGRHIFTGGFLGLDNIGVFDRSKPMAIGNHLEQADGTAWMAFYCSSMMSMAFELADGNPAYSQIAYKFFSHYIAIAEAMNSLDGTGLWDETDGFYYDHLHTQGRSIPLKIRSIVGIIPLFTVDVLFERVIHRLPEFQRRMNWMLKHRKDLDGFMTFLEHGKEDANKGNGAWLLGLPTKERLERILKYLLDEEEFLSDYGIRSLSKYHEKNPFCFDTGGAETCVSYVPGESDSYMFGGNSNWRGPIWFPMNHLLIEALERYHQFYGESFKVECPTGSGNMMTMQEVADEIRRRLVRLFLPDEKGTRPSYARGNRFAKDEHWKDLVLFYEYFHGDTGRGLGANHQTGWTALVAPILEHIARNRSGQPDIEG